MRVCSTQTVTDYSDMSGGNRYHEETVCWDVPDTSNREPTNGGVASGGGLSFTPADSGAGTVSIANPTPPTTTNDPGLNIGWNSGAYSIEALAADWKGTIKFDVPDVLNSRPGGVAIGMALVANLPTLGRNGYQHLAYGLVFTGDDVKVIQDGAVILTVPYAGIRALRATGATTDMVSALMFGNYVKWMVNGSTLFAGAFTIGGPYALDATLFTALDAVDNPAFVANTWDTPTDDELDILLPAIGMTGEAQADDVLDITLFAVEVKLSEYTDYSDMDIRLPAISFVADELGDSVAITLAALEYESDEGDPLPKIKIELPMLTYWASMDNRSDDPDYSILFVTLPAMTMTGECAVYETIQEALSPIAYRADDDEYADIQIDLAAVTYSGRDGTYTRTVDVTEYLGVSAQIGTASHISIVIIERIGGSSTVVVSTVMSEDASEQITAEDQFSIVQTFLADCLEQIGTMDRVRVLTLNTDGTGEVGADAWVVNSDSGASSRYDRYGFNSFASFGSKHYGAKADGIYVLEGATDAGIPITSGAAFGKHDFGGQNLKALQAVYVGVSAQGALFLKVGDGTTEYTYRARRTDADMRTQRFDPGRGLRSNYFTFDLTSEGDAFELDSVTFNVLASQRKI